MTRRREEHVARLRDDATGERGDEAVEPTVRKERVLQRVEPHERLVRRSEREGLPPRAHGDTERRRVGVVAAHVAEDEAQGAVGQLDGIEEISAELEALRARSVPLVEDDLARRVRVRHQAALERREELGIGQLFTHVGPSPTPCQRSIARPIVAPIAASRG